jgi:hypothetical protein
LAPRTVHTSLNQTIPLKSLCESFAALHFYLSCVLLDFFGPQIDMFRQGGPFHGSLFPMWKMFQLVVFACVDIGLSDKTASPHVDNPAAAIIAFGAAFYATGVANLLIDAVWRVEQRLKKIRASRKFSRARMEL